MGGGIVTAVVAAVVPALIEAAKMALLALLSAMLVMGALVWSLRKVIGLFKPSSKKSSSRNSASSIMDAEYKEFSKPSGFDDDDWFDNGDTTLGRNFKF
ncbi:MAG: hypothetical protein K2Y10_03940 [Burkholderiaceae bacterium]|nr:hypothetical protein [Burkholderiaceae bacterium]